MKNKVENIFCVLILTWQYHAAQLTSRPVTVLGTATLCSLNQIVRMTVKHWCKRSEVCVRCWKLFCRRKKNMRSKIMICVRDMCSFTERWTLALWWFQDVSVKDNRQSLPLRDGKVVFFSFSHFSGFVLAGKAELYWVMYCVSKGNGIVEESSCNSNILSKLNLEFNQSH